MVFFYPNQAVVTPHGAARVINHNYYTGTVQVLRMKDLKSWIMESYSQLYVQEFEGFLWGMEKPFSCNLTPYVQYYRY
jgi:hypothetical protein